MNGMNPMIAKQLMDKNMMLAQKLEDELQAQELEEVVGGVTYTYSAGGRPISIEFEGLVTAEDIMTALSRAYKTSSETRIKKAEELQAGVLGQKKRR